jgi:hypothetical protein
MRRSVIKHILKTSHALVAFVASTFIAFCFLLLPFSAQAIQLDDEYDVKVTTTELGPNSYKFEYAVTNNNQQAPEIAWTGLGGLRISIPEEATISNIEVPDPFRYDLYDGYWTGQLRNGVLVFHGNHIGSIYPKGFTARFSFQADGVTVGETVNAVIMTYWDTYDGADNSSPQPLNPGCYHTLYTTTLIGPIGIPLPVPELLISRFDNGVEGWGIYADGIGPYHSQEYGVIYAIDIGGSGTWYFTSPSVWAEHDWTKYIGGTIEWDINVYYADGGIYDGVPDATIMGDIFEERIRAYNVNTPEIYTWMHFSIKLIPETFVDINNEPITAEHFYRVMSSFERLFIRGEYIWGPDRAALDNVKVSPGPTSVLQDVIEEIHEIPPDALTNSNMGNALTNKINEVLEMIYQGLYQEAIDKLKNDILRKTDGCATVGEPDQNDWIKDCDTQAEIYQFVVETIEMLEGML